MSIETLTGADVIKSISDNPDFSEESSSYSPFYSTTGLQAGPGIPGIGALYFHYNRATRPLCDRLFGFSAPLCPEKSDACRLFFDGDGLTASLAFYKQDAFIFEALTETPVPFFGNAAEICPILRITETENAGVYIISAYSRNPDARDPDELVPFSLRLTVFEGCFSRSTEQMTLLPRDDGRMRVSVEFVSPAFYGEDAAPDISAQEASGRCRAWFDESVKDMNIPVTDEKQKKIICTAVYGLVFNTARAQGSLSGHLSAFPSRGGYPTHFTWDTYFQNLAYEIINTDTAEDFLLQICDNMRPDGKIPQFMCSTWGRPHDAQPALLGWAAQRIFESKKSPEEKAAFAEKMIPYFEKNNRWWLTCRMTDCGLIFCPGGLETGQDNSPRFDAGPALSADMNSYLYNQLCFTARLCGFTGKTAALRHWSGEAEKLKAAMLDILYDKETGLFFDVTLDSREPVRLLTPNCFLPLWAGVFENEEKRDGAIRSYLLNKNYFFGKIPFPSVAYSESVYDADGWWRGPTWMPVAYLMLETLEKYGFSGEYYEAADRLYRILLEDGDMHELFDSETGRGLGCVQQGWSCAVFIRLSKILKKGCR